MKNYPITQDKLYQNFLKSRPQLAESSKENYKYALTKFCNANNLTLTEIINNCKKQQNIVIEKIKQTTTKDNEIIMEKEILEFDVNSPDSHINIYLDNHINYCKKNNNSNKSINSSIDFISTILKYYNIKLPDIKKLPEDTTKWYPLTKEDIKFIISDSTLTHETLIGALKDSGMRLRDAVDRTLADFMKGTSEYHDYVDVNEFIDNAPSGMICTLKFQPHKTKRFGLECVTFIGPETCDKILQNFRRIKNEYLPKINKQHNLNLTMSKEDALFPNQKKYFKGHNTTHNLSDLFNKKNKKLKEHRINLINQQIQNGELSEEDFKDEVEKIPKFHAHGLRKFFISTIAKNCGNLRICAIMEGHTPPIKTDSSYVDIDVQEIKEAYMAAIPDLSLENVDVKLYTSDVRRETEAKIHSLENTVKEKEAEVQIMKDRMDTIEKKISEMDSRNNILNKISEGKM